MRANILHVFELASVSKCLDIGADIHRSASVFPNTNLLVGGCGRHFCFQYDNTALNPPEIYVRFFLSSHLTNVVCPGEAKLSLGVFSWSPWYLTHASVKLVQFLDSFMIQPLLYSILT